MEQEVAGLPWSWRPRRRRREALDVFFEEGDAVCFPGARPVVVEVEEHNLHRLAEFPCGISGCCQTFDTISGYELHYNSCHRHTCRACRRTLPSNHLLEIHLRETHDPLFQLTTGHKFPCLVEGCEDKFESTKSRQGHLIKVHKYPASFRFHRTKQSAKSVTPATPNPAPPTRESSSMDVSDTTPQQRAPLRVFSHKVPQSICFGQGSSRGFQRPAGRRRGKHWHQTKMDVDTSVQIENVNMADLKDALGNQRFQVTVFQFPCLVEGCEDKFESTKSRQGHLIKVHKYPASFRFHRTKQSAKSVTPATPNPAPPTRESSSMDVSDTTPQQRAPLRVFSHKVPQSICFGQGSSRGFQRPAGRRRGKHWHQTKMDVDTSVQIENVNMADLKDALGNQRFQVTVFQFPCLVEGCEDKFESTKSRQGHLIKVHKYPASFRFHRTKQSAKSVTPATPNPAPPTRESSSMDVSDTTPQQRAPLRVFSHKVPQSICFGQGSSRGFQRPAGRRRGKHWHQTKMDVDTSVQIENVNMADLKDALGNQ